MFRSILWTLTMMTLRLIVMQKAPGYALFVMNDIFIPLGRMSLSVYLVQIMPIAFYYTQTYEIIPINRRFMVSH